MDKYSQFNINDIKQKEKWVHDLANHFSTLNYMTRNCHLSEAKDYIRQLADYIQYSEEINGPIEKYKKNLLHQLCTLEKLLQTQSTDKALIHIKSMHQHLDTVVPEVYCRHPMLNTVLYEKKHLGIQHGIQMRYSIFLPQKIDIPDPQFLSIFFNLLDNAIESCISSGVDTPFIHLKTNYKGNIVSLQMINSKNPSIQFTGKTTKNDTHSHGFGLTIIEEIVQKHYGYSKWIDHGNTFESVLMFKTSDKY